VRRGPAGVAGVIADVGRCEPALRPPAFIGRQASARRHRRKDRAPGANRALETWQVRERLRGLRPPPLVPSRGCLVSPLRRETERLLRLVGAALVDREPVLESAQLARQLCYVRHDGLPFGRRHRPRPSPLCAPRSFAPVRSTTVP
jgi:hypothetical protein